MELANDTERTLRLHLHALGLNDTDDWETLTAVKTLVVKAHGECEAA